MKKFTKEVLIICIIALVLRLLFLGSESLWIDEAISLNQAGTTFTHLTQEVSSDTTMPLYPLLLFGWLQLVQESEIMLRLPSVLFGVLSVLLTFIIAKKVYGEKVARIASMLMTLSPIAIFYSQEARVYSLLVFLVLLSTYFFLRYLDNKKYSLLWLVIINTLILYAHIYAALFIVMQTIYIIRCKKLSWKWIFAQVVTVLLFAPWLVILFKQMLYVSRNLSWLQVLNAPLAIEYLFHFFNGPLVVLIFSLLLFVEIKKPSRLDFSFLFFLPFFLIFLAGFFIPLFHVRYVLFTLPFFFMFFAVKFQQAPKIFLYVVLTVLLGLTILQGVTLQKDDWKSVATDIENYNGAVLVHPYYHQEVLSYYVDTDCFYNFNVYGCMTRKHQILSLYDKEPYCHADASVSTHQPLGRYDKVMLVDVRSYLVDEVPCTDFFNKNYKLVNSKQYGTLVWYQYEK